MTQNVKAETHVKPFFALIKTSFSYFYQGADFLYGGVQSICRHPTKN